MRLREWLKETYAEIEGTKNLLNNTVLLKVRPRIECCDGFSFSCQAGIYLYCLPMLSLEDGDYDAVELGFLSSKEELLVEYAKNSNDYTGTIYPYVPVDLVDDVIKKHGGIKWF